MKASNICVPSVATPTITEGSSATSYEIAGTSITLTCTSTSGSGTYAWKLDGNAMYVILIMFRFIKTNATNVYCTTLNICRSGETSTNYVVPTTDNTAAGSYTCSVTVSTIASTDSTGYAVTATGLFFDMVCEIYLHVFY